MKAVSSQQTIKQFTIHVFGDASEHSHSDLKRHVNQQMNKDKVIKT